MSQSGYIAAALLAGFVFWLAAKGRLPTYAAVLWGQTAAPVPGASLGQQAAAGASQATSPLGILSAIPGVGAIASTAAQFLPFLGL